MRRWMVLATGLGALCAAVPGSAQWYFTGGGVYVTSDNARASDEDLGGYLGLGRYLGERFGVDLTYSGYDFDLDQGGKVDVDGFTLSGRYYILGRDGTSPYIGLAAGSLDHDGPLGSGDDFHYDLLGGVSWKFSDRVGMHGELRYRFDSDDTSNPARDDFDDWLVSVGLTVALGAVEPKERPARPAPVAAAAPAAAAPAAPATVAPAAPAPAAPAAPRDGDRDGVADPQDDCPDTPAGRIVGPDGCEKEVIIELNGVHFDFDKDTQRPDATAILDKALDILQAHPDVPVEVHGHTDWIGTDEYNQDLSERRARRVYDYLVAHGIPASRLTWRGHGESMPIVSNDTDAGRARNRRVELRVGK